MNVKSKKTCLIIAGMHRSGTSALTRTLSLLGADLPNTLMPSHASNETGHWESTKIADFNDKLLEKIGSNWYDWTPCTDGLFASHKYDADIETAKECIASEYGDSRFMVLKDPRICRLLPFWLKVVDEMDMEAKIILPIRNPLEVAESHFKRDGIDKKYTLLLWARHVLDAEIYSRGWKRVFTSYTELLDNWSEVADNIARTIDLKWPRKSHQIVDEIDNFLSPKYRHHTKNDTSILNNSNVSDYIKNIYAIMIKWANSGEDKKDWEALDKIKLEFDNSANAFGSLVGRAAFADKQANQLNQRIADLEKEKSNYESDNARLNEIISQKTFEAETKTNRINELEKEKANLNNNISHFGEVIAKKSYEIENNAKLINDFEQKKADLVTQISQLNDAISQKVSEANAQTNRLNELEQEKADLINQISQLNDVISQKVSETDAQTNSLNELEQEKADFINQISQLNDVISKKISEVENHIYRINELEIKNGELLNAKDHEASLLSEREQAIDDLNIQIVKLNAAIFETEKENAALKEKVIVKNGDIKALNSELSDLKQQLNKEFEKFSELENSMLQASKNNAEIFERAKELKIENQSLSEKLNNATNKIFELENTLLQNTENANDRLKLIEVLKAENQSLAEKLGFTNTHIDSLNTEISQLKTLATSSEAENIQLNEQILTIKSELDHNETGKKELIKRLIIVQQKLDLVQVSEVENVSLKNLLSLKDDDIKAMNQELLDIKQKLDENSEKAYFFESAYKQKSAEADDRLNEINELQNTIDELKLENTALDEKLHETDTHINKLQLELAHIQSVANEKDTQNQQLNTRISIIREDLERSETGKNEIIKRLIIVQQKLDTVQAAEAMATKAKIDLIEQITHEERPYFSLKRSSMKRKANLLRNVGIVDEEWYIQQYPDVAEIGMNPTLHWVKHGKKEGRKPRE